MVKCQQGRQRELTSLSYWGSLDFITVVAARFVVFNLRFGIKTPHIQIQRSSLSPSLEEPNETFLLTEICAVQQEDIEESARAELWREELIEEIEQKVGGLRELEEAGRKQAVVI